jgi:hypothetical protein
MQYFVKYDVHPSDPDGESLYTFYFKKLKSYGIEEVLITDMTSEGAKISLPIALPQNSSDYFIFILDPDPIFTIEKLAQQMEAKHAYQITPSVWFRGRRGMRMKRHKEMFR